MGYLQDREAESKSRALRNLEKAKQLERELTMYTYVTPDKRLIISHQTAEGLYRIKQALGIKDEGDTK